MVYYSAPVTPVITKATVIGNRDAASDPSTDKPNVRWNLNLPDLGQSGAAADLPYQGITGYAHGRGQIDKAPGEQLAEVDCTNTAVLIHTDPGTGNQYNSGTATNYSFEHHPAGFTTAGASGSAEMPAYYLWQWPDAMYGTSMENRPTAQGGPWNPSTDDPNAAPPATATGWEIVEPGRVIDAYLLRAAQTEQNDWDPVAGYLMMRPGYLGNGGWSSEALSGASVIDQWGMPNPDPYSRSLTYQTIAVDHATLPQTVFAGLTVWYPPSSEVVWPWRWNNLLTQLQGQFKGSIQVVTVFRWQPPTYRWILSEPPPPSGLPPLRQHPRRDGLGASTARRHYPPDRSVQASNRHRGGFY